MPSSPRTKLSDDPETRIVLLGASNLTISWPRIMDQLQCRFTAPLQVFTANGLGRSYVCARSTCGIRQLPGILTCGLWDALPATPKTNTASYGLLTDFGNDLLFGRTPIELAIAAEECVQRLRRWDTNCQIVMTRPPVTSVETLGWLRFTVSRLVLFPFSRLTLAGVKSKTVELDERLQEVASKLNVPIGQPNAEWYGLDPIHVRRRYQAEAFGKMMDRWTVPSQMHQPSVKRRRPTAASRWVFGRKRHVTQPSTASADTRVFAY